MPDYRIFTDDRGYPMLHRIREDGSVDPDAIGSLQRPLPLALTVVVNGVLVPDATITVNWFDTGPRRSPMYAGGWGIQSPSPTFALLMPGDELIPVEFAGRRALAAWTGPGRIGGAVDFPFTFEEWASAIRKI